MKKLLKKLIKFILILCLIIVGTTWFLGYRKYKDIIKLQPIEETIDALRQDPYYLSYDKIPVIFLDAIVAVEDERLYTRETTLDVEAVLRATLTNIKTMSFAEGGSTIPQQVIKNVYFDHTASPIRKVAEYYLTKDLLNIYTKQRVLETYVNIIYYGNGAYSIGQAADHYFSFPVKELNDGELTILAGLPNAPSVYDLTVNFPLAKERQAHVLYRLVETEKLTQEEADEIYRMEVSGYE